jgi:hypothetical protein
MHDPRACTRRRAGLDRRGPPHSTASPCSPSPPPPSWPRRLPALSRDPSRHPGRPLLVDPTFHGGGFHQGGYGSYLDPHVDFNIRPTMRTDSACSTCCCTSTGTGTPVSAGACWSAGIHHTSPGALEVSVFHDGDDGAAGAADMVAGRVDRAPRSVTSWLVPSIADPQPRGQQGSGPEHQPRDRRPAQDGAEHPRAWPPRPGRQPATGLRERGRWRSTCI